jgi:UDP-glucuronate decarboxylase
LKSPINLGNPKEYTMIELAEHIVDATKSKSKIIYESLPSDDPKQRCPDISLAKTHLSWEPKTNLEDGIHKTVDYFRNLLQQ